MFVETTLGEERKERKRKKKERRKRKKDAFFQSFWTKERTARCSSEEREREREREREEREKRAMVVVQAWDDFYAKAEELLRSKPLDCRYTVKYKHNEGKMVLKVTDDSQVRNENVFK